MGIEFIIEPSQFLIDYYRENYQNYCFLLNTDEYSYKGIESNFTPDNEYKSIIFTIYSKFSFFFVSNLWICYVN